MASILLQVLLQVLLFYFTMATHLEPEREAVFKNVIIKRSKVCFFSLFPRRAPFDQRAVFIFDSFLPMSPASDLLSKSNSSSNPIKFELSTVISNDSYKKLLTQGFN